VSESGADRSWDPSLGPYWVWSQTRYARDAGGKLDRIEGLSPSSNGRIAFGEGHDAAIAAARAALDAGAFNVRLGWRAGAEGVEPPPADPEAAIAALATPLVDALERAAEAVKPELKDLALVDVTLALSQLAYPPRLRAVAANAAFRRRATRVA